MIKLVKMILNGRAIFVRYFRIIMISIQLPVLTLFLIEDDDDDDDDENA